MNEQIVDGAGASQLGATTRHSPTATHPTRSRRALAAILPAAAIALAVLGSACAPLAARGQTRPLSPISLNAPSRAGSSVLDATEGTDAIIQGLIQQGNQEQVQAIATHNSSLMADTSTSRYYQELVQTNQHLLDGGVLSIELVKLEWGAVQVNGPTATVTTYETWRTTYADSSVDESRDRNVYTLVENGGMWKIDADDHPDSGHSGSGSSGTAPGATGPGRTAPGSRTSPSYPQPPAPSVRVPGDESSSPNWSGYVATGGTYTAVNGTWTVPHTAIDGSFGAGAAWVGIGGVHTRDLIQAGTQEVVSGSGNVSYQAWIETLPQSSEQVPLAVAPGDQVTVSISQQDPGNWLVSLTNDTTGKSYQRTVAYNSSLSSAEWVEEAPSAGRRRILPLDNFGTIQFAKGSTVKNGATVDIAKAGGQPVTMIDSSGQAVAVPSALGSDGASFSVQRTGDAASGQDAQVSPLAPDQSGRGQQGFGGSPTGRRQRGSVY